MIFVYRHQLSDSAQMLAEGLGALRVRGFDGRRFLRRREREPVHFRRGDAVVCWGEELPEIDGLRMLNNTPIINKMEAAVKLKEKGVETVEVSQERPRNARDTFEIPGWLTGHVAIGRDTARELAQQLQAFADTPIITWLPRKFHHVGGDDLLNGPREADFWVKKENIIGEFRIHCFLGKSIRAGSKVKDETARQHHPWIRSAAGGWRLSYTNFKSTKAMRELAAKSLEALGLQFGAVDIAQKADGKLMVLECNRAPGLGDGTAETYKNAITRWFNNEAEG